MNSSNRSDANSFIIIASDKNWIVGDAEAQLKRVSELPGVLRTVGMPDLHPGRGFPIGAAVISKGVLYPQLAGNDIGCGMALWQTNLSCKKLKLDKWVKKLKGLELPMEGDLSGRLNEAALKSSPYDTSLGTIGGGNHFAELQVVDKIVDERLFCKLGFNAGMLVLLVHSGSRGLGESVLRDCVAQHGSLGVDETSDAASHYLRGHTHAMSWGRLNRELIAERFLSMLNTKGNAVLDLCHNSITQIEWQGETCWLHRKGAAPSDAGPVILPGSRGALSYVVNPQGDQKVNAFSTAHGAGRKWARSDARSRLEKRYTPNKLKRTDLGGRIICEDKNLLYEEAPQAYKKVEIVVQDLIDAKLINNVATFKPLITYKTKSNRS